jgi:hypothetical protein
MVASETFFSFFVSYFPRKQSVSACAGRRHRHTEHTHFVMASLMLVPFDYKEERRGGGWFARLPDNNRPQTMMSRYPSKVFTEKNHERLP